MEREEVISSTIKSVGYEPICRLLEIEFRTGNIYQYVDVPISTYVELLCADSKTSYFDYFIRHTYPSLQLNGFLH